MLHRPIAQYIFGSCAAVVVQIARLNYGYEYVKKNAHTFT